jgi:hypothetical protein
MSRVLPHHPRRSVGYRRPSGRVASSFRPRGCPPVPVPSPSDRVIHFMEQRAAESDTKAQGSSPACLRERVLSTVEDDEQEGCQTDRSTRRRETLGSIAEGQSTHVLSHDAPHCPSQWEAAAGGGPKRTWTAGFTQCAELTTAASCYTRWSMLGAEAAVRGNAACVLMGRCVTQPILRRR